jgi:hypothetical protein
VVEGANSRRGLANRTSSCGCCGRGYRIQSRHRSLRGRPSADTYDNLCSLSDSQPDSQPYSHRYAYSYANSYANTTPDTHSCAARTHAHPYAHADADPDAHPYARLPRTVPKLGVAILR